MDSIISRYRTLCERIEAAAAKAGRPADSVKLTAVSKTRPAEDIRPLLDTGHRLFGENRVQEAASKWPDLCAGYDGVKLHLIGPLQTNKVRDAVTLFDVIETLDRPKLAEALARAFEKTGRPLPCYAQVNIGREPQKSGVLPEEADAFIETCRRTFNLAITGVMAIPPVDRPPAPYFTEMRGIAERNGLSLLSMGMSDDFEEAIAQGATHVRLGTLLFGRRDA